jgi:hypothetical protein
MLGPGQSLALTCRIASWWSNLSWRILSDSPGLTNADAGRNASSSGSAGHACTAHHRGAQHAQAMAMVTRMQDCAHAQHTGVWQCNSPMPSLKHASTDLGLVGMRDDATLLSASTPAVARETHRRARRQGQRDKTQGAVSQESGVHTV